MSLSHYCFTCGHFFENPEKYLDGGDRPEPNTYHAKHKTARFVEVVD